MPVSVHTDDNPSPRTELLSPTSESTTSFHQQRSSVRSSSNSTSPRDRRNGDHRRQRQHHANGKGNSSRNWWRDRERELLQSNLSPKDLIRMVIEAEKETTKLHDTLSNTVTMLDEESRKCASLERDTVSTFTRLNSGRERAQAHAEAVAQDLRVAQFELEHTGREIERLKEELEVQKQMREEGEAQLTRVKNAAHKLRQERMVDLAREEGRRQGFEAGFLRAQAETTMKMQATTGGSALVPGRPRRDSEPIASTSQRPPRRETSRIAPSPTDQVPQVHRRPEVPGDQESIYEELSSIPIITPPQGLNPIPNTHKIPMRTGYSPTRRPARTRTKSPTPSVDHYPVSIPPQEVIEQTQNINPQSTNPPREEWVTGEQHRDIHGHAPSPTTAIFNPNVAGPGHGTGPAGPTSIIQTSGTPTSAAKHRVKFRRPTLAKTKQTATSWYRSLSFRKKQKPKMVIDPTAEEEEEEYTEVRDESAAHHTNEAGPSGTSAAERSQSLPTRTSDPAPSITAPPNSRHSKAASMSSTVRTRDYGFPFKAQGHRPRVGSVDSMSTHTSQFDMLTAPSVSMGGYSRSGPANTSVASLGSNAGAGKAPSVSGRSAKSAALSKKLSVIKENPSSREPTPGKPSHSQAPGQVPPGASRFTENDIRSMRPMRSMRSMKSGKSTNSRMVVLNPDPESPDWARQASQPRTQIYAHPPSNSALMQSGMPNSSIYEGSGVIPPLRTKKSGQTIASLGGSQIGLNTPTPLPKSKDKGKGKEIVPPMIGHDRGASGSGHGTSPGIGINIQTPSDRARQTSDIDRQDGDFLSPRHSSRTFLPHSTPRHSASVATSTTRVPDIGSPHGFPSLSPIRGSSPKIFLAQGLSDPGNDDIPKQPFVTVLGAYTSNAGMTPGPMLSQLLPPHTGSQAQPVGTVSVPAELGAELHQTALHRAGSSSSLRSLGSFGKFDPNTYQDPALWAVPPGAYEGRPVSRNSSRRISYADM